MHEERSNPDINGGLPPSPDVVIDPPEVVPYVGVDNVESAVPVQAQETKEPPVDNRWGWGEPSQELTYIEIRREQPGLCQRIGGIAMEAVKGVGTRIRGRVTERLGETSVVWALDTLAATDQIQHAETWYAGKLLADTTGRESEALRMARAQNGNMLGMAQNAIELASRMPRFMDRLADARNLVTSVRAREISQKDVPKQRENMVTRIDADLRQLSSEVPTTGSASDTANRVQYAYDALVGNAAGTIEQVSLGESLVNVNELRAQGVAIINTIGSGEQPMFSVVGGVDYARFDTLTHEQMDAIYAAQLPAITEALAGRDPHEVVKTLTEFAISLKATQSRQGLGGGILDNATLPFGRDGISEQMMGSLRDAFDVPPEISHSSDGLFAYQPRELLDQKVTAYGTEIIDSDGNKYWSIAGRPAKLTHGSNAVRSPILEDESLLVPSIPDITFMNQQGELKRLNALTLALFASATYPGLCEVPQGGQAHHDQQYANAADIVALYERVKQMQDAEGSVKTHLSAPEEALAAIARTDNLDTKRHLASLLALRNFVKNAPMHPRNFSIEKGKEPI